MSRTVYLTFREFGWLFYKPNLWRVYQLLQTKCVLWIRCCEKFIESTCARAFFRSKAGLQPAYLLKNRHRHKCLPLNNPHQISEWVILLVPYVQGAKLLSKPNIKYIHINTLFYPFQTRPLVCTFNLGFGFNKYFLCYYYLNMSVSWLNFFIEAAAHKCPL